MSDLETFAAHARAMATAEHRPECCRCGRPYCCGCVGHPKHHPNWEAVWCPPDFRPWLNHAEHCPGNPSAPPCPGCVTDADRAWWARLADEVDAYLAGGEDEALFAGDGEPQTPASGPETALSRPDSPERPTRGTTGDAGIAQGGEYA